MADRKITDLTALAAGSQATGDLLTIVDVSEGAAADKNKKITVESLFKGIPSNVGIGTTSPSRSLDVSGSGIHVSNTGTTGAAFNIVPAANGQDGAELILSFHSGTGYGPLKFNVANGERMRIDSSGRLLVGTSTARTDFYSGALSANIQLEDSSYCAYSAYVTNGNSAFIFGRGNPASGSAIGNLSWMADDGTDEVEAARISGQIDGTPGSNDMPGRLVFSTTADGSSSPTERMRIDSSGRLLFGTTSNRGTWFNLASTFNPAIQIEGTGAPGGQYMSITANHNASGFGGRFLVGKTRGTAVGATTVVQSGDEIGGISLFGSDGSEMVEAANIVAYVDGTPGSNDMPGRLTFATTLDGASSPSEQMRITSDGVVNLGDSPGTNANADLSGSGNKLYISFGHTFGANAISTNVGAYTGAYTHHAFYNGNGFVGDIQTSGSSTSFNTSSDYRLKENVVDITDGITRVKQLQPRRFNFIADATTTVDGFVAHEAATVVPEAVTGTHDEVDEDDNPVYQGIDQSKLVPLLTAALQEAIAEIETLKTKVAALEAG